VFLFFPSFAVLECRSFWASYPLGDLNYAHQIIQCIITYFQQKKLFNNLTYSLHGAESFLSS
jgi:hypothetical protein